MVLELYPSTIFIILGVTIFLGSSYITNMFLTNRKSTFDFFSPLKLIKIDKIFDFIFNPIARLSNKILGINLLEEKKKK